MAQKKSDTKAAGKDAAKPKTKEAPKKPSKAAATKQKKIVIPKDGVPERRGKRGPEPTRTRKERNASFLAPNVTEETPLTPRMRIFVERYLVHLNGSQAAIEAGYSHSTATTKCSALMRQPNVAAAIHRAMEERSNRTKIDQDFVLNEIFSIANANIGDFMDWKGRSVTLRDSKDIPHELKALISEVCETEDGYKIKLYDKMTALRLLAQHLGLLDKSRFAKVKVHGEKFRILQELREGKITATEAAIECDMQGIPIPDSVRNMMLRDRDDQDGQDDGQYATLSPEEMDKRYQERMALLKEEREKFVPERQAEVRQMKAELSQAKKDDTFMQKGGSGGKEG